VKEKVFTIKSKLRYTDEEFEDALAYIDQLKELN
ncbi:YwgA family protein, partial [Heyndrickxia coagulans DSM 1 = ATCC 7050]|nr:YwgA family protein [Heyndrickxia coagulans DSM 1 = ATCC 7050]